MTLTARIIAFNRDYPECTAPEIAAQLSTTSANVRAIKSAHNLAIPTTTKTRWLPPKERDEAGLKTRIEERAQSLFDCLDALVNPKWPYHPANHLIARVKAQDLISKIRGTK